MPLKPGHKLSPGRKKGSKNLRTLEFLEVLAQHNWNSAKALIHIHNEAIENYYEYKQRFLDNRTSPMEDNASTYLKIALGAAQDLASYEYPKQKAIEKNVNVTVEQNQEQTVGLLYDKVKAIFSQPKEVIEAESRVVQGNGVPSVSTLDTETV